MIKQFNKLIAQFKKYTPEIAVKNIIYHFLTRERKKSFGPENPEKTIYVIRSLAEKSRFYIGPVHNLMANYFYVLSHIQYASQNGWIPVVDQVNYPVYNSQKQPVNGTNNPWEFFWQQPGGVSLEEAYHSKNVVLSKQSWFWEWDMGYRTENYTDDEQVSFYGRLAERACLNSLAGEHVEKVKKELFPEGKKILGVNVRTGGHTKQVERPGMGHPIQPELDELISLVEEQKNQWGMDAIFLACDTEYAAKYFKEAFGNELITYPRLRAALGTEYASDPQKNLYAPGRAYQTALDYLTEMELLSSCDAITGAVTSGLRYAVVRNSNRYEHRAIIDKGRFEDRRVKNDR